MSNEPKHLWYDWVFLITVGLFISAIVFVILDTMFAYRFPRIIASCLGGGICGIITMSIAEDVNLEFRCSRKYKRNKEDNDGD